MLQRELVPVLKDARSGERCFLGLQLLLGVEEELTWTGICAIEGSVCAQSLLRDYLQGLL